MGFSFLSVVMAGEGNSKLPFFSGVGKIVSALTWTDHIYCTVGLCQERQKEGRNHDQSINQSLHN